jgi:hypothetical protein
VTPLTPLEVAVNEALAQAQAAWAEVVNARVELNAARTAATRSRSALYDAVDLVTAWSDACMAWKIIGSPARVDRATLALQRAIASQARRQKRCDAAERERARAVKPLERWMAEFEAASAAWRTAQKAVVDYDDDRDYADRDAAAEARLLENDARAHTIGTLDTFVQRK